VHGQSHPVCHIGMCGIPLLFFLLLLVISRFLSRSIPNYDVHVQLTQLGVCFVLACDLLFESANGGSLFL
jgi:hypothetical protein